MTAKPVRLLVVGGSGFIGRHIVTRAAAMGWQVTSLGLSPCRAEETESKKVQHIVADITDLAALRAALPDPAFEYVVNCGGYSDHSLYSKGGRKTLDAHFEGVLNLAEILPRDILAAFINLGSSEEYGNIPAPQIETQREAPISPYSTGKVAATHFLQMLHRTENFPAATLRLFLCYGPGQNNHRLLPQIIQGCLENRSFPVSEGKQLRDFCFIMDIVDAIFSSLDNVAVRGEIINIGSGQPISVHQMIETIRQLVGRGVPLYGKIAYRPGENMELYPDISKARSLLSWSPKVPLSTGLEKTIDWFTRQK